MCALDGWKRIINFFFFRDCVWLVDELNDVRSCFSDGWAVDLPVFCEFCVCVVNIFIKRNTFTVLLLMMMCVGMCWFLSNVYHDKRLR